MTEPAKIAVAGDWHGNTRWALHAIGQAAAELEGEPVKILLQLGDFLPTFFLPQRVMADEPPEELAVKRRVWVNGYLRELDTALRRHKMQLWFIDGNHEDWESLNDARQLHVRRSEAAGRADAAERMVPAGPHPSIYSDLGTIFWLPRGYRWEWHGKTWLAFGGAGSPNRAHLTEGWNWWPDEEITIEQVAAAVSQGHADVLVSHEVMKSVHIQYEEPPRSWRADDLARCELSRHRLDILASQVKPGFVIHGHHHIGYCKGVNQPWGLMYSSGLEADGGNLNLMILDLEELTWKLPGVTEELARLADHQRLLEGQLAKREEAIREIARWADSQKLSEEDLTYLYRRIRPEVLMALAHCDDRERND